MRSSLRLFYYGGLTSYRALFSWLTPWILVPSFVVAPIVQTLLFSYVGRAAGIGSDAFFVIGNSVQYASIPCLFAMGNTVSGERFQGTLPLLLASPARRIPLFLGRSLPAILNGIAVSMVTLLGGALLLGVRLPWTALAPLAFVVAVCSFSCAGLGVFTAAIALRVRESAVLSNIGYGVLLIFSGANIPLQLLPEWMSRVGGWLPMTHGIAAARLVAGGSGLASIGQLLLQEAGLGLVFVVIGLLLLAYFENEARRLSTLDAF
jgi:ABC-2 type transport system permease protein